MDTVYTLLLYYLICGIDKDDIFIMSGGIPEPIRKNIKHIYFPHFKHMDANDSNFFKKIKSILVIIAKRSYGIIKLRMLLFFKTRNCEVEVYGQGHLNFSFPLYEYENSYIIEDGLGNYTDLKKPTHLSKFLNFFGFYFKDMYEGFGTHENIKKVYLTKNEIPEIIKDKVEVIDMDKIWKDLSENEKNEILKVFNMNLEELDFDDETALILTEPLSESNFIALEDELEIYKNIIEKFKDKTVVIKPHPRESKNYGEIFPDIKIVDKYFPIELLNLIGIEPSVACSITSTALLNFKNSQIYIYEGKLNPLLDNHRTYLINAINNNH